MKKYNTIGELTRDMVTVMTNSQLTVTETIDKFNNAIAQSTNLFRLSKDEYNQLIQTRYDYHLDMQSVKYHILAEYCLNHLLNYKIYRSINAYKKYLLEE